MKTTFRIDIKQNGKDRLALESLYINNHRMRGASLHRDCHPPEIRSLLDLFKIVSEHDDWANVNCAETTGELLKHLTREDGKTYQRTNIGGGITISTAYAFKDRIRVEGFITFDPETIQLKTLNDATKDIEFTPVTTPKERSVSTTLLDKGEENKSAPIPVTLHYGGDGIYIQPEEHGDTCSSDGHGTPVMLELYEGKLRLVVWSDINHVDPTYVIDLAGASENLRVTNQLPYKK